MKYGFIIPGGNAETVLDLAVRAEEAGWDGVFYWDGIYIKEVGQIFDAWTMLGAMSMLTSRVRIGALLTNLARRRPWKVAREAVTVDHLSKGRLVIPTGLGALDDGGYSMVGEPTDRKTRAELLDEALEIMTGLWTGKPFRYQGKHYKMDEMTFLPPPVQRPRIPIWVVGAWQRPKSMRRALQYDGIIPTKIKSGEHERMTPADIKALADHIRKNRREKTPFDIICEGETAISDKRKGPDEVRGYAEAGATWWMETRWSHPEQALQRIKQGPPRID